MRKLLKRSLYRLIFSYIYAFLGALLFYYLERKPERNREIYSRLARKLHQEFTNQFTVSINESDFKQFMEKAFQVVLVGNKPDWSILGGLSFTMTSLTTVGFGHITPETPLGQIVTVLYCCVGLPIAMLTLKTLGEVVSKTVYKLVYVTETRILCRNRPQKVKMKTFFVTFTLMILTLCAGGLTQVYLEDWSFVEGVYAWFATLSTIGYGDYVPGLELFRKAAKSSDNDDVSLWFIISAMAVPCLAALCVVSGVLNSLVQAIEEFKIVKRSKMKNLKRLKQGPLMIKYVACECQDENNDQVELTTILRRARSATV